MTARREEPADPLPGLFHHRWAIPTLAALGARAGGAKFVTLQHAMDVSRDSLARTLQGLLDAGLVARNPGYGHPMRPEYLLTRAGTRLAPACGRLREKLQRLKIEDLALNKWSLPVVYALSTTGGRFNMLRSALPGITPRALTQALRDIESAGLASRTLVDEYPPRTEYALTRRGRGLIDHLRDLAEASKPSR